MAQRQSYDDHRGVAHNVRIAIQELEKIELKPLEDSPRIADLPDAELTLRDAQRLQAVYLWFGKTDLLDFSPVALRQILDHVKLAAKLLRELIGFRSIAEETPNLSLQRWSRLQDGLESELKNVRDSAGQWATVAAFNSLKLDERFLEIEQERKKTEDILVEARKVGERVAAGVHAVDFQTEAEGHEKSASKWLWVIVGLVLAIVIFSIVQMCLITSSHKTAAQNQTPLSPAELIQLSIARLTIISVLVFALAVAVRNYRAHCHNRIVNRHRANALNSFKTFVMSGESPEIRNQVLLETTRCIFSAQNTGHTSRGESPQGPSQIVEIAAKALKAE